MGIAISVFTNGAAFRGPTGIGMADNFPNCQERVPVFVHEISVHSTYSVGADLLSK